MRISTMKFVPVVLFVLFLLVGCRTAEQYVVHVQVARGAPAPTIQIWQTQYQADASTVQTKTFPFDIGRAAKIQAVPLP
ncbi:MAG: hypothetical protein GXP31_07835 [Kiritimatiellaeota bacterium]|nr:hypothetical protein [Kiritimatiellota bacterium]